MFIQRLVPAAVAAGVFVAGVFVAPAAAHAGDDGNLGMVQVKASFSATYVQYIAAPGAANRVSVTATATEYVVTDVVAMRVGPGCRAAAADLTAIACDGTGVTLLRLFPEDGDDSVTNGTALPLEAGGGAGADTIRGGPAADFVHGDAGLDVL
jgi:Ca2+-binding RTX toxin-like protein